MAPPALPSPAPVARGTRRLENRLRPRCKQRLRLTVGHRQNLEGAIHDESGRGVALVLDSDPLLAVGQHIQTRVGGWLRTGVVRHVTPDNGTVRLGIEWRDGLPRGNGPPPTRDELHGVLGRRRR